LGDHQPGFHAYLEPEFDVDLVGALSKVPQLTDGGLRHRLEPFEGDVEALRRRRNDCTRAC
jgi:hypothetical protein